MSDRRAIGHSPLESLISCGLQAVSSLRLLIRRSLVRAQVGEPKNGYESRGRVASRGPLPFRILDRKRGLSNIQYVGVAGCALFSACGGSGEGHSGCTPAAVVIQLEGDSIAAGSGATDAAFTPAALLRAAFPSATVVSTAQPGSTSSDRISGAPIPGHGRFLPFPQGVVGNIYLTNWGVNDARLGVPIAEFKVNLRKIASVPGAVLQTPTPMTGPLSNGQSTAAYAQAVREVGAELGVPVADVQAYVLGLPNWQALLVDGVHPRDELYALMVRDVIAPVVRRQVARSAC